MDSDNGGERIVDGCGHSCGAFYLTAVPDFGTADSSWDTERAYGRR